MNDLLQDSFKPISGDAYVQNRKLVELLRETIAKLDSYRYLECIELTTIADLSNYLEAEVSIIVSG